VTRPASEFQLTWSPTLKLLAIAQPRNLLQKPSNDYKIYLHYIFRFDMSSSFVKSAGAIGDLSFALVALLRADGHLCNVLTHIASGDWRAVEQAIVVILSPRASPKKLSNVARNILELACDNRGITGRIMGPFFFNAIARIAGRPAGKRLEKRIRHLRRRMFLDGQTHLVAHPRRATKKTGGAPSVRKINFDPAAILAMTTIGTGP
jgi:hypothetical protein